MLHLLNPPIEWPPIEYYDYYKGNPHDIYDGASEAGTDLSFRTNSRSPSRSPTIREKVTVSTNRHGRVRRGSEGWEVQALSHADRERMLDDELAAYERDEGNGVGEHGDGYETDDHVPLHQLVTTSPQDRPGREDRQAHVS